MAAISQSVPTLLGGVSQQPDPIKLPGQVRQADNVYLDPTFGCVKRPATQWIDKLDANIPADAKWFSIFRDNNERYVACCFNNDNQTPKTRFKVFEADTGIERNVTYSDDVGDYLDPGGFRNLEFLTINDFTFICNPSIKVSMSNGGKSPVPDPEAFVVVNQVGYNTTYSIDLLKENDELEKTKTTRASELNVTPGSWEDDDDDGGCSYAGVKEVTESDGLKYRLTVNCQPTQVTKSKKGDAFPSQVRMVNTSDRHFADWAAIKFGRADAVAPNSYAYHQESIKFGGKNVDLRVEARCVEVCKTPDDDVRRKWALSSVDIVGYQQISTGNTRQEKQPYKVGLTATMSDKATQSIKPGYGQGGLDSCDEDGYVLPSGSKRSLKFKIIACDRAAPTTSYSYKSVYTANVQLLNGGSDVPKGKVYTTTLNGKSYKVKVKKVETSFIYKSDFNASYTTPSDIASGSLDVGVITGDLIQQINAIGSGGWQAEGIGNVIRIWRNNGKDFNLSARGGSTENAMYGIKDRVNDISKLPTVGFDGSILMIQNSIDSEADDYYVRFQTAGGIPGAGNWEEVAKPGIKTSLNASTMPHALKRKANGDFQLIDLSGTDDDDPISWADREVGDEDTNPVPTFVGQKINNMVFHMNRFGFLSEDTVILSQPGDYFNFFVGSAIAVSDADPIDMAATSTRPANLKAGISTVSGLLLFSTDAQFLMNTRDVAFGPSTVQINEISNYAYRTSINPLEVGTSIFFPSNSTNFPKVFEMSIKSIGDSPQVAEDTRIVPEYVPNNLQWGAASSNNNLALFGIGDGDVYCFKYWNQGDERALAGWFRWRFKHEVHLLEFYDDVAYIVFFNPVTEEYVLGTMNLMDDPNKGSIWADDRSFEPRLDLYVPDDKLTTSDNTGDDDTEPTTRIELPEGTYVDQELAYVQFTRSEGTYFTAEQIQFDDDDTYSNPHIIIRNRVLRGNKGYNLGIAYNMSVELPGFYTKNEQRVDRVNIPMVETVNIELYLSGSYNVLLEKLGYDDRILYFDSKVADVYLAGRNPIVETSKQELHVFSRGDHASVTINSLDPLPAGISGYTWEGHYNNRGITRL